MDSTPPPSPQRHCTRSGTSEPLTVSTPGSRASMAHFQDQRTQPTCVQPPGDVVATEATPLTHASCVSHARETEGADMGKPSHCSNLAECIGPLVVTTGEQAMATILNGDPSEQLVTHGASGNIISRAKLQCLQDGQWLNDEVINYYMVLLMVGWVWCGHWIACHSLAAAIAAPIDLREPTPRRHKRQDPLEEELRMQLQQLVSTTCPMMPGSVQERDKCWRNVPPTERRPPRCHFFSSFFLNKLYKDANVSTPRWNAP